MGSDYWRRIAQTVGRFAQPGDILRCIRIRRVEDPSTCELCGYSPIHWLHTLQNSRTSEILIVGSECIRNYAKVHEKRFGRSADIRYPPQYKKAARFLNAKFPGTVTVEQDDMLFPEPHWEEVEDIDFRYVNEQEFDDLFPEGMGPDEVDWDSFDWDED